MLLVALFFLPLLIPSAAHCGPVEGIVFSSSGPVENAIVEAYSDYSAFISKTGGFRAVGGDKPGEYRLKLPAGSYYLTASGYSGGLKHVAYHGANPVTISDAPAWIPLMALPATDAVCSDGREGVSGHVTFKGNPVSGGRVSIYPANDGYFRGMGLLTTTIDSRGNFRFDIGPGSYAVVARRRNGKEQMKPLEKGDLYCRHTGNQVTVTTGQSCSVSIECYPKDDLYAFLDDPSKLPPERRVRGNSIVSTGGIRMRDFRRGPSDAASHSLSISGRVTDMRGQPVSGAFVTAYNAGRDRLFQMHIIRTKTPNMAITDDDGRYRIGLSQPGMYYLVARQKSGEAPDAGEMFGLYEGNANHSVDAVEGSELTGIDIRTAPVMPAVKTP
ncbi:MAG: carboxypeptidase regulatory-like domain-containing protein [Nitrospirae bacterium]|nr:carboxypeptidase regulatory-like domain-containing protein [Nitrospirota bacterium]